MISVLRIVILREYMFSTQFFISHGVLLMTSMEPGDCDCLTVVQPDDSEYG